VYCASCNGRLDDLNSSGRFRFRLPHRLAFLPGSVSQISDLLMLPDFDD
jgi:hypothetical protein